MTKPAQVVAKRTAPQRIVVIGASLAGLRAVEALRKNGGYSGSLTLVGAEPHLPYDRPPLSKGFLRGERTPDTLSLRRGPYEDLDIDLRLGRRALALDSDRRTVRLDDGTELPFDRALIATGAAPRQLPFVTGDNVHVLRTLDHATRLREALTDGTPRVAIIGGGVIGTEVAASCQQLGLAVTVLEASDQLLPGLGPVLGAVWARLHRERGVVVRCGVQVTGARGDGRVHALTLADGSEVATDLVVVGIGVRPNVDWLAGSGVAVDGGVTCAATLETSVSGVFAAGDVASWPNPTFGGRRTRVEHWSNAVQQGAHAALNMLAATGEAKDFGTVPDMWTDQYDTTIQVAGELPGGLADAEIRLVNGGLEDPRFTALCCRDGVVVGVVCVNRGRDLWRFRSLIASGAEPPTDARPAVPQRRLA